MLASFKKNFIFLLFIPVIALLLSLSLWQYNRGQYKKFLKESTQIYELSSKNQVFDRAFTSCKMLNTSFLLDNKILNKAPGYLILTPCENDEFIVLLERGWTPKNRISNVNTDNSLQKYTGLIYNPGNPMVLKGYWNHFEKKDNNYILQYFNIELIKQLLKKEILPYTLKIKDENFFESNIKPTVTAEKHFSYSIQWFLLALISICYFFVLRKKNA